MSKGINKDSMSSLLEGLTSVKTSQTEDHQTAYSAAPSPKSGAKPTTKERICTSVDTTIMNKIRSIAEKEGVLINELITLGLGMVISKYEESHGQIRPKKPNKGNIANIFR
uniref:DUF3408 domain-containing protein n=1 Tax=Prevotella sp. GTC17254 TaxID=3236794 RepID=A0AB33J6U1_9BACT